MGGQRQVCDHAGEARGRRGHLAFVVMGLACAITASACAGPANHAPAQSASASAAPSEVQTSSPGATPLAEPEIRRHALREFAFDDAPVRIAAADEYTTLRIDPFTPFFIQNAQLFEQNGNTATQRPLAITAPEIHAPLTISNGIVITVGIGDGPIFDASALKVTQGDVAPIAGDHNDDALTQVYVLGDDLLVGYYADWEGMGFTEKPAPTPGSYRATDVAGSEQWQHEAATIGVEQCTQPLEPAGVNGWLVSPDPACNVAINAQTGNTLDYGDAEVIAGYLEHLVVYDHERGAFISYRADNGEIDAQFALAREALNQASPLDFPVHNEVVTEPPMDLSDELSYADLLAGLQTLSTITAEAGNDAHTSWIILTGGEVMGVDERDPAGLTLSKAGSDETWVVDCQQVRIGGNGTRALCVGGGDSGTLFDLQDDGGTQPLWRMEAPLTVGKTRLYPFNGSQWILRSDAAIYLLAG